MLSDEFGSADPEERMTCPYNPAHDPTRKRLAVHLQKCRKQYPALAKQLKTCPNNIQHLIPQAEYEYHKEICPDRNTSYVHRYHVGQQNNDCVTELYKNLVKPLPIPECDENWEEQNENTESNVIQDVLQKSKHCMILENHSNESRSIRKALQADSRRKYKTLLNFEQKKEIQNSAISSSSTPTSLNKNNELFCESDDSESVVSCSSEQTNTSLYSDESYQTAFSKVVETMSKIQLTENKKKISLGRGRGRGRGKTTYCTNIQVGIGRGKKIYSENTTLTEQQFLENKCESKSDDSEETDIPIQQQLPKDESKNKNDKETNIPAEQLPRNKSNNESDTESETCKQFMEEKPKDKNGANKNKWKKCVPRNKKKRNSKK